MAPRLQPRRARRRCAASPGPPTAGTPPAAAAAVGVPGCPLRGVPALATRATALAWRGWPTSWPARPAGMPTPPTAEAEPWVARRRHPQAGPPQHRYAGLGWPGHQPAGMPGPPALACRLAGGRLPATLAPGAGAPAPVPVRGATPRARYATAGPAACGRRPPYRRSRHGRGTSLGRRQRAYGPSGSHQRAWPGRRPGQPSWQRPLPYSCLGTAAGGRGSRAAVPTLRAGQRPARAWAAGPGVRGSAS